jgi:YHS domain-containing protein
MMGSPALFPTWEDTTDVNIERSFIMPEILPGNRLAMRFTLAVVCLLTLSLGVVAAAPGLQRVETKKVCMVNNQVFEKDQIPVTVEGKTYYGCCEMCKDRLTKDAAIRSAVDPVTGKPVDKATAVIGALPDGKVLYFESETTFGQYGK